ncbi:MAG: C10 family peptidase [Bacteroidales bacterium]|nr:C10 family peptidase [Bacteroidales bacterium]
MRIKLVVLLLVGLLLGSPLLAKPKGKRVTVQMSSSERAKVLATATDFLIRHGAPKPADIELSVGMLTRNVVFLNDWPHRLFVVVARDSAAAFLRSPVLGFSMGATRAHDMYDSGIDGLLQYYDTTLTLMRNGTLPPEGKSYFSPRSVKALLQGIKWRQFHLRRQAGVPDGSISGCGPTAVGQLMAFHQYPADWLDWSKAPLAFPAPKGDTAFFAPLVARIGLAVKANYGPKATSSTIDNVYDALVHEFGFSPRLAKYWNMTEQDLFWLIFQDLIQHRPCLLASSSHILLCDGCYEDFFHLNMGWSGNFDGWYRFLTPQRKLGEGSYFFEAILHITAPTPEEQQWDTVYCAEAGQLPTLLSPIQRVNIGRLRVTGFLNGTDIRLLRQMAGCIPTLDGTSWRGALSQLDLSDARIVSDTACYYSMDAARSDFHFLWHGVTYKFAELTHDQWLTIKDVKYLQEGERRLIEVVPDSLYRFEYHTNSDIIGTYMFRGCHTLQHVRLPRTLRSVRYGVFRDCPLLESVTIPDNDAVRSALQNNLPCPVKTYSNGM